MRSWRWSCCWLRVNASWPSLSHHKCLFLSHSPIASHPTLSDSRRHSQFSLGAYPQSCLDYCNSLLAYLAATQMVRLESVLHAAAWLVLQLPGRAPVSAAMHDSLHWLSFRNKSPTGCAFWHTNVSMVWHLATCHAPVCLLQQLRNTDSTFGPRAFHTS